MPIKSKSVLSPDFLLERGVAVTKPLLEWLSRAMYLSKNRADEVQRTKYEHWALNLVEAAIVNGGVETVDWVKQSPIMPSIAVVETPKLLTMHALMIAPPAQTPQPLRGPVPTHPHQISNAHPFRVSQNLPPLPPPTSQQQSFSPQPLYSASLSARQRLADECSRRAPVELRHFVQQVFELIDVRVQQGTRSYEGVSFVDVITTATELQRRHQQHQLHFSVQQQQIAAAAQSQYMLAPPGTHSNPIPLTQRGGLMVPRQIDVTPQASRSHPVELTKPMVSTVTRRKRSRSTSSSSRSSSSSSRSSAASSPRSNNRGLTKKKGPLNRVKRQQYYQSDVDVADSTRTFFDSLTADQGAQQQQKKRVVGVSTSKERLYSRVEPTAEDLRAVAFLPTALSHVLHKSKSSAFDGSAVDAGLKYLSDQLKGMRQDLRCQDVRSEFCISVYERHARLCLQLGNLSEFTQCQASLKKFYDEPFVTLDNACVEEFTCYRLAYFAFGGQYDALAIELATLFIFSIENDFLVQQDSYRTSKVDELADGVVIEDRERAHRFSSLSNSPQILNVIELCAAVQDGDSFAVINKSRCFSVGMLRLIRIFLQKQRVSWIADLASTSKGNIPFSLLLDSLGFLPDLRALFQLSPKARRKATSAFDAIIFAPPELSSSLVPFLESYCFFVDGDVAAAEREFSDFFKLLKLDIPPKFSFLQHVYAHCSRAIRTDGEEAKPSAHVAAGPAQIDCGTLSTAVRNYLQYLNTRRDANIGE